MPNLNEYLTFEHESEHVLEPYLLVKKNFSTPKIYNANGDIKKRWYVYFSFRNPETGKLQRMKNVYGIANKCKTKEDRMYVLSSYRKNLVKLLKEGFNPFEDNTELYKTKLLKEKSCSDKNKDVIKVEEATTVVEEEKMTIREAFEFGLSRKEKILSATTKRAYANRIKNFIAWAEDRYEHVKTIDQLEKKVLINYLNEVLDKTSARNRNNTRIDLSSVFQVLEDNEIIALNFIKKIPVLKTVPKRNKTYTHDLQQEIYTHLETHDPILLLYIKFISYGFLRPIEVCRLKIKDIDLKNRTMQFKAKNSPLKTKIIPDILFDVLPDMSNMDKEVYLFSPEKFGDSWVTSEGNKRDYFSKRFKKVVKDKFNLDKNHGLYSFRHTFITKLYRKMVKESSPFEAKSRLMLITGHTDMIALEKYLRDIDAELPQDYSELLK